MSNYFSNSLTNLLDLFTSHAHKPAPLKGDVDVSQMVEHVVDVVDPRIRVIGRYSNKLLQPLAHTWDYLSEIANMIPNSVVLNRETYSSDTRMKLVFESQGFIQNLLNSVPSLIQDKAAQDRPAASPNDIYLLLCMEKKEYSFLGAELVGDVIEREVLQTKMSFSNRKILSAGYSKDDARLGFKKCTLEGLLQKAHDLILESRNEYKHLIERKRKLHHELHSIHDAKYKDHSSIFTRNDHLINAPPELLEIERQLAEIRNRSESPDYHLSQTIEVLNHPEQYLKMQTQSAVLSDSGIKLPPNSGQKGTQIEFAEVEVDQQLKRAVMIVNCPAKQIFSSKIH